MIDADTARAILERLTPALAEPTRALRPLRVGTEIAGWIDDDRAARLAAFSDVFVVDSASLTFRSTLGDEATRSAALAGIAVRLAAEGALSPWRDELYAVAPTFGASPWFRLERAAARYFGVHTWAAHLNGAVRGTQGIKVWFARRSPDKALDPGMLDNLVGGGIAVGATREGTLVKEAWEEAGIPGDLSAGAVHADALHIWREQPDGLQSETIFASDLWLPDTFVPDNQDGEAVAHRLEALDDAARLIALRDGPDQVTADASLVVLDFLLRQGAIDPALPIFGKLAALRHPQAATRRA